MMKKHRNSKKTDPSSSRNSPGPGEFPIVALGASAGGLEALEAFFANMPPDSGMAFVVITHLDPNRETLLPELLAKYTSMEVQVAEEGTPVEPNTIYTIPVNAYMSIQAGMLHLEEPLQPRGHRLPVDHFFQSLAEDQAENAFCVILSGTGTDGTLGIKAVKEAGGMTLAQDVNSARYSGMPYSAIQTGVVDVVLPVEEIPAKLLEFISMPAVIHSRREPYASIAEALGQVCKVLHSKTGADFASYKVNTLIRRIERRMIITKTKSVDDYIKLLRSNPEEDRALSRDLLIGVTSFFRDPEAFDLLRDQVIPELLKGGDKDEPIRIWTAGCASGEETYSIAILLREAMEKSRTPRQVQIFGTDMDSHAIARARTGAYMASIKGEVPEKYLEKYFRRENGGYRVVTEIREMVVFAPHNLLSDPPFSQIDLITCRNVLIYLDPKVQARIIPTFYHSLRPGGFLFLGPSETVGASRDLFDQVDKRWKLFRWKPSSEPFPRTLHIMAQDGEALRAMQPRGAVKTGRPSPASVGQAALLQRYIPPSVIINSRQEVLHTFSRLAPFLEHPVGESTLNILKMAGKELRPVLRAAIHQAFTEKKPCTYERVRIETDGTPRFINIVVEPIREPPSAQDMAVVSFEPIPDEVPQRPDSSASESDLVHHLEDQLRITTEQLQANLEESERGEEELKSSNEELMSINEELQSANEELETSKEELQALNEELVTVNSELQSKLEELSQANNDMQNLMQSSQVATIFLDKTLRIKRYTHQVADIFNLIEGDIGRPIRHISSNIDYPELEEDAKRVLRDLKPLEREVRGPRQVDYLLRVLPYRTMEDVIEGVVLTFLDISRRKSVEEERRRLADIVESSQDAIIRKDFDGTITSWNHGAEEIYGYAAEEMIGKNIDLLVPPDKKEELADIFRKLQAGNRCEGIETVRLRKDGKPIHLSLTISPIRDEQGKVVAASAIGRDITERKERERALVQSEERFRMLADNISQFAWIADEKVRIKWFNKRWYDYTGTTFEEMKDWGWRKVHHPDHVERVMEKARRCFEQEDRWEDTFPLRGKDGQYRWFLSRAIPIRDEHGAVIRWFGTNTDITELREAEQALAEARDAAETANRTKSQFLANMSHEIRTPITVIQGAFDLLQEAGLEKENLQVVDMARSASATLLRLVDDILDFAKMEAGAIRIVEEPFELRTCIENTVRAFHPQIQEKGLKVTVDIAEQVPAIVVADPDRFQQVLNNLVGNAVKFTEQGEIGLRVEPREETASGRGILEVSVTDTGIGIPEDQRAVLFDNFTQADSSHSRRFGGAGLGLAISKGLVERMGGTIEAESSAEGGSTFRFRLPMIARNLKPQGKPEAQRPVEGVLSRKSARILLAEDDPMISTVMTLMLREEGWEVVTAHNGRECVEVAGEGHFDVILMDVQMPEMNGYEAARAIRGKEKGENPVPIIALTAHVLEDAREEALKSGMNGYLTKPVDRARLIATVRSSLKDS